MAYKEVSPKPVSTGGTGATTLTGLILGNGTSAMTTLTYTASTSWTPALKFGGATTGITYTTQSGKYLQIGGVIIYEGLIVLSSKGSATGTATITGFPVSISTTCAVALRTSLLTFTAQVQAYVTGTTFTLEQTVTGNAATVLTNTNFAATSVIYVSGIGIV